MEVNCRFILLFILFAFVSTTSVDTVVENVVDQKIPVPESNTISSPAIDEDDEDIEMMEGEVYEGEEEPIQAIYGQGRADIGEEEETDVAEGRASEIAEYGSVKPFDEVFETFNEQIPRAGLVTDSRGMPAHLVEMDMMMVTGEEKSHGFEALSQSRMDLDAEHINDEDFDGLEGADDNTEGEFAGEETAGEETTGEETTGEETTGEETTGEETTGEETTGEETTGEETTGEETAGDEFAVGDETSNTTMTRFRRNLQKLAPKWPNGIVYYAFERGFRLTRKFRKAFTAAIHEFRRYTCIKLRRRRKQRHYISIGARGGCWSFVGMRGGRQKMSLDPGCHHMGVIVHEFIHALGFLHEQARWDRDRYVKILLRNVKSAHRHNFRKTSKRTWKNVGSSYDYHGIMHYGSKFFSRNGRITIWTKNRRMQNVIGRQRRLSFHDQLQLNRAYRCGRRCRNRCPRKAYRASDCKCYCNSGNPKRPRRHCASKGKDKHANKRCALTRRGYLHRGHLVARPHRSGSWWGCVTACRQHRRCRCASYNVRSRMCYRKHVCHLFSCMRGWLSCVPRVHTTEVRGTDGEEDGATDEAQFTDDGYPEIDLKPATRGDDEATGLGEGEEEEVQASSVWSNTEPDQMFGETPTDGQSSDYGMFKEKQSSYDY